MKVNAERDQNSLLKSLFEALLLHGLSPYHTGAPKGLFQALCKCPEEVAGIVVATTVSPVPSSHRIPVFSLRWEARVPNKYRCTTLSAHATYAVGQGERNAKVPNQVVTWTGIGKVPWLGGKDLLRPRLCIQKGLP